MGEIKSALEIALERTKNVTADKELFEADKYKKEGKKIISLYINEIDGKLDGIFKGFEKKQLQWVKEGMFQALLANFLLPLDDVAIKRNSKVAKGFYKLISDSKALNSMFQQLESFFQEYIEQRKMVRENLEQQFAPRLKQKQEQLAKQMGTNITLDPASDPEFIKYLKQSLGQLEERYLQILNQVRDELQKMFVASPT